MILEDETSEGQGEDDGGVSENKERAMVEVMKEMKALEVVVEVSGCSGGGE